MSRNKRSLGSHPNDLGVRDLFLGLLRRCALPKVESASVLTEFPALLFKNRTDLFPLRLFLGCSRVRVTAFAGHKRRLCGCNVTLQARR